MKREGIVPELDDLAPEHRHQVVKEAQRAQQNSWLLFTLTLVGAIALGFGDVFLPKSFWRADIIPIPWLPTSPAGIAFFGLMLGVMLLGRRILRRETLRRIPHLCPACAYNLTGNTSGVCPECGRAIGTGRKPEETASPSGQ